MLYDNFFISIKTRWGYNTCLLRHVHLRKLVIMNCLVYYTLGSFVSVTFASVRQLLYKKITHSWDNCYFFYQRCHVPLVQTLSSTQICIENQPSWRHIVTAAHYGWRELVQIGHVHVHGNRHLSRYNLWGLPQPACDYIRMAWTVYRRRPLHISKLQMQEPMN